MPAFMGLEGQVGHLAVHVELQLLRCVIADPHRRGLLITAQPGDDQFRQSPLSADPVHDLDLAGVAGGRANKPISPYPRLVVVPEFHQRQKREGGVPEPTIAVIPIPCSAQALGKRGRGGGDDSTHRSVGQSLQCDERPLDCFCPRSGLTTAVAPPAPERFGARERFERIDCGRRTLLKRTRRRGQKERTGQLRR